MKILIVEDTMEVIDILLMYVSKKHEVTVVVNFQAAEYYLKNQAFDLVITDFNFPGGDGNGVAKIAQNLGNKIVWLHTGDVQSERIQPGLFSEIFTKFDKNLIEKLKAA